MRQYQSEYMELMAYQYYVNYSNIITGKKINNKNKLWNETLNNNIERMLIKILAVDIIILKTLN